MIKTLFPLALAAAVLGGCATVQPDSDGIARAGIGQTAYVNGPKVTPLALMEDSRCPMNARCVWAGQVRVTVRIDTGAGYVTREMTSNKPIFRLPMPTMTAAATATSSPMTVRWSGVSPVLRSPLPNGFTALSTGVRNLPSNIPHTLPRDSMGA